MAQSFDSWYTSASLPWESLQEAQDRYNTVYGVNPDEEEEENQEGNWLDRYTKREEERER